MVEILLSQLEQEALREAVKNVAKIKGDIVEVGVYQGGSAKIICEEKGDKVLHLYDTFKGIQKIHDNDLKSHTRFNIGRYHAEVAIADQELQGYPFVCVYPGIFPETYENNITKVSLLHLDVDLYEPTKVALEIFWPMIPKGGKVVLHDYPSFEGVKMAVDEVLRNVPKVQITREQAIITK